MNSFFKKNKGAIIGIAIGLVVAVLILTINFWRTLLIALCVLIGYLIGGRKENREAILDFIQKILPVGRSK